MHLYRAYVVLPDDHITKRVDLLDCFDDQSAKERAKQLVDGNVIELWDRDRMIARFEPKSRAR